jgi:hypothetical protein
LAVNEFICEILVEKWRTGFKNIWSLLHTS